MLRLQYLGHFLCPSRSKLASAGSTATHATASLLALHAETSSPSAISVSSGFSHPASSEETKRMAKKLHSTSTTAKSVMGSRRAPSLKQRGESELRSSKMNHCTSRLIVPLLQEL